MKTIGVLGGMGPQATMDFDRHLDIGCEIISTALSQQLDQAILAMMEGRAGPKEQSLARVALEQMRVQQVDGTILGCTELPLLLQEQAEAHDLINPLDASSLEGVHLWAVPPCRKNAE